MLTVLYLYKATVAVAETWQCFALARTMILGWVHGPSAPVAASQDPCDIGVLFEGTRFVSGKIMCEHGDIYNHGHPSL